LHGWRSRNATPLPDWLSVYGSEAEEIQKLIATNPALGEKMHPRLPYPLATVVWGARHELACTLEDILSRRTRSLLLDARATIEAAPAVAVVLATELGRDRAWEGNQVKEFTELAKGYLHAPSK
jgi:glycerol-3-phosphate dehydrogenase